MLRLRPAFALILVLSAALIAVAHDQLIGDLQPPYTGPGFSGSATVAGSGFTVGSAAIDFPRNNVRLLGWMTLPDFGPGHDTGNDCWGYTSPSGTEYAIMGLHVGTGFVDISDPGRPVLVAMLPGPDSIWRDMKVYQEYCYAVSEGSSGGGGVSGGGIQVFDLTQIDSGAVTLVNTVTTPGTEDTHNVAIDEASGFLYRAGGNNEGLRIYDLANPANPTYVGSWTGRYVHDVQVQTYTSGPAAGRQLAYCCGGLQPNGDGDPALDIIDVTNKSNTFLLRRVYYPNVGYAHQGWLSEDLQHFYLNDERDEMTGLPTTTHVFDVSDPANAFAASFFDNGNMAIGHNLYTANGLMYQANYRSGLRVLEMSNPLAPTEIAYFDTYTTDDNANFNGAWSVYPYFDSGVVVVSDLEKGLFVLWVGDPLLDVSVVAPPATIDLTGESIVVSIQEQTPGDLEPGSAMLHYDAGAGLIDVPLVDLGFGNYQGFLPSLPCGTAIDYFVSARSTNNVLWKSPEEAPATSHRAIVAAGVTLSITDDVETDMGWTPGAPGDTATTGIWERGDPLGTAVQPELDHTPDPASECWFTGQGVSGGSNGAADIDGGATTLLSPIYDLSNADRATVSYWRWFANDGNAAVDDDFVVDVTSDGVSWANLEVLGPGHPEASGGWFGASFDLESTIALTSQVQLRFIASDNGSGSIVEAAIDDLALDAFVCSAGTGVAFCFGDGASAACPCGNDVAAATQTGCANSSGVGAQLLAMGEPKISADTLAFVLAGGTPTSVALLASGDNALPMGTGLGIPVFDGLRCVGGNLVRHGTRATDLGGDAGTWGPPGGPAGGLAAQGGFTPGQTRHFAATYRDDVGASCMTGVNFSSAVSITFEP